MPRKMLMCKTHWFLVPEALRRAVWAAYQPGQEQGKAKLTKEWMEAAEAAVEAVARAESRS